jgi:hypothetical protein
MLQARVEHPPKQNPTENGFYWIKRFFKNDKWEPAKFQNGSWWLIGHQVPWQAVGTSASDTKPLQWRKAEFPPDA